VHNIFLSPLSLPLEKLFIGITIAKELSQYLSGINYSECELRTGVNIEKSDNKGRQSRISLPH
jgi:hypothetical protein